MSWAAAIGAGLSLLSGDRDNSARRHERKQATEYQTYMSNTAHQREVEDLRKAGLNPILSAGGGASTPGGLMAPVMPTAVPAIQTGVGVARAESDIKMIAEQIKMMPFARELTEAQTLQAARAATKLVQEAAYIAEDLYKLKLENLSLEQRTNLFKDQVWLQQAKAVSDSLGIKASDIVDMVERLIPNISRFSGSTISEIIK